MRKLICYGDSNTWGYDPRSIFGDSYTSPWPQILQEQTGWEIINLGENGRTLPADEWDFRLLGRVLAANSDADFILIMLGTNDLLRGRKPETLCERYEALLLFLKQNFSSIHPILIAPPQVHIPEFAAPAQELANLLAPLAELHQTAFLNPQQWSIPLAFDGVHFSEEGHKKFARQLLRALLNLESTK